ncbi:MAG: hypothetical protein P8I03_14400 [Thalassotalea sp.]|nr:hypothetical protein [Thalassotalea sp.]
MFNEDKYLTVKQGHAKLVSSTDGWQKPVLILPCSKAKASIAMEAINLYQGRGYLGIIRTFDQTELLDAFDVYFLSAKYGLVGAKEIISPYEQVLTNERINVLLNDNSIKSKFANFCVKTHSSIPVYLVAPKKYKKLFSDLVDNQLLTRQLITSEGGIGYQRSQLKRIIQETMFQKLNFWHKKARLEDGLKCGV